MEFKNIDRNILYLLGNEWLKTGALDSFETGWIFDKFADIPDKNIHNAINFLKESGLVELAPDSSRISLTQKGLLNIRVIKLPENGKIPFPAQLD